MASYTFDQTSGRYRGPDGRYVPDKAIRDAVDNLADEASARLAALSERLSSGRITLDAWRESAMAVIKDAHLAAGIAAHGGIKAMDQQTYGYLGHTIRDEYQWLARFAQDIDTGRQALTGVVARAQQYGQAARGTFEAVRARDDLLRGMDEERSILSTAEHCSDCVEQAGRGWSPIGSLVPIGARRCRSNCRCSITRRHARSQESTTRLLRAVS